MSRVYSLDELERDAPPSPARSRTPNRNGARGQDTVWSLIFQEHPQSGGPFGGRNCAMCKLAGALRRKNMPYEAALQIVQLWNRAYCEPPLPDSEVEERLTYWWMNWPEGPETDLTRAEALSLDVRRER